MIMRTVVAFAVPAVLLAGCAGPSSAPVPTSAPAPAPVMAGCEPAAGVQWSPPATATRLTKVTMFGDTRAQAVGQTVLDEPFTPSIAQVTAPEHWTAALATSLGAKIGRTVRTGPAVTNDEGRHLMLAEGRDDPAVPEMLLYEAVETITAGFTVACTTPVSGTFTSWTTVDFGGVTCGSRTEPTEVVARLARRYCPRTAAPDASFVPPLRMPG